MDADGRPWGPPRSGFQISYVGDRGPYLVTANTFPGRNPIVRVDEYPPLTIPNAGQSADVVLSLVNQMRSGRFARVRYHRWPTGAEDMVIDLAGFDMAWHRLLAEISPTEPTTRR